MSYYVYIIECSDGTYYTGITNQLDQRIQRHQQGRGAKYTRGRLPIQLRYVETGVDRSWALRREYEIKQLSKAQKHRLIEQGGVFD